MVYETSNTETCKRCVELLEGSRFYVQDDTSTGGSSIGPLCPSCYYELIKQRQTACCYICANRRE